MDLWIRSQDKTILMKVNRICFERNIDDEPTIYGYENYDNYERLGIYKTKERALEVLDEIKDVLMPKIKVLQSVNAENNIDDLVFRPTIQECGKVELLQYSDYVYEMPKE